MQDAPHTSPFDAIRHEDEQIGEFWSARELYKILGYTEWRNFNSVVIKRAMKACEENGRAVADHFVRSYKAIIGGCSARKNSNAKHNYNLVCLMNLQIKRKQKNKKAG